MKKLLLNTPNHTRTKFYYSFGDRGLIKFFETVAKVSMGELQFAPTKNYQYIILLNS